MKNKYEALIEAIINDNDAEARKIFHKIVVEKSRDIYESLMDEEMGGNAADQFVNDISDEVDGDEEGVDGDFSDEDGDDLGSDGDDIEDMHGDEDHDEHSDIESKIDDLMSQIEELKNLMGGNDDVDDSDGDVDDLDNNDDFSTSGSGSAGGDDEEFDADETFGETVGMSGMSGSGMSGSGRSGSGKSGSGMSGSGMSGSGMSGSGKKMESRKTELDIMREYVDKIGDIYKQEPARGEGKTVGKGGDEPSVNDKSIVGPGADFGGESKNIVNGKANSDPNGTSPNKGENNYGKKGQGMQPGAGQFMNVPGQDAGHKGFKTKASRDVGKKDSEGGRTVGSGGDEPKVNKRSEIGGRVR